MWAIKHIMYMQQKFKIVDLISSYDLKPNGGILNPPGNLLHENCAL